MWVKNEKDPHSVHSPRFAGRPCVDSFKKPQTGTITYVPVVKGDGPMAKRNRQTLKKREKEMARRQKKQEKAERIAARKAGGEPGDDPEEGHPAPVDDADTPSGLGVVPVVPSAPTPDKG